MGIQNQRICKAFLIFIITFLLKEFSQNHAILHFIAFPRFLKYFHYFQEILFYYTIDLALMASLSSVTII